MGGYLAKSTMLINMFNSTKKGGYYFSKIRGVTLRKLRRVRTKPPKILKIKLNIKDMRI
jgi:hypothetical protein